MNGRSLVAGAWALLSLAGCSSYSAWYAASGPNSVEVVQGRAGVPPLPVVDINAEVDRRLVAAGKQVAFADGLAEPALPGYAVGAGDMLQVSVWEAPPATLFGAAAVDPAAGLATTRQTTFPEQMVAADGTIDVPFAGPVPAAGKPPQEIAAEIARRLDGKAHRPQVVVRVTSNVTANATVVGEVEHSVRMPLTSKGERLLDAIAAAGGVKQPVSKTSIRLSRAGNTLAMPLDTIIRDPGQNVFLRPGDVVTALFQPHSFIALGATGRNEEIGFEAQGISLAQAIGRIGGLEDTRSDATGIFIFRFEEPAALPEEGKAWPRTPEGRVPLVYRLDLKDPRGFLAAQDFPLRDRDVLYVANAPSAELQKFLNILTSSIFSAANLVKLK